MRRNNSILAAAGVAVMLASTLAAGASAATLRPCLPGHKVKVVKGKATMVVKGKTVRCAIVKKPVASPTPSSTNPPIGVQIRFSANTMNSLSVRAGLTVTLRNADTVPHTFVIASEGISVLVPANNGVEGMSAFLAPGKTGTYEMTTSEDPNIKATLVVIP